jgi:uncharacterized integral membrane protein
VGKGWLKERCGLESRTNFFFPFKKSPKTGCGLDSRIYGNIYITFIITLLLAFFILHNTRFLKLLFNDGFNCNDYIALVIDA